VLLSSTNQNQAFQRAVLYCKTKWEAVYFT